MVDGDSQSRKQRKISIVSRLGGLGLHADVGGLNLPLTEFIFGFPEFNSNVHGELPTGCPFSIKIQLTVLCLAELLLPVQSTTGVIQPIRATSWRNTGFFPSLNELVSSFKFIKTFGT